MSAKNLGVTWVKNLYGAKEPLRFPLLFGAGSTTPIKSGEILDYATGTAVPLASDKAMAGIIAIADAERRSGDLAGYQQAIIPRPGDVFELDLAAAGAPSPGDSLYFSDSQTVKTSGTNALGVVADASEIPTQGFQSVNPSFDAGTTLRTVSRIQFTVKAAASYFAKLQV